MLWASYLLLNQELLHLWYTSLLERGMHKSVKKIQMVRCYCSLLFTVFTLLFVQPLNDHVPLPTCNMKVVTITMGRVVYLAKDCGLVTTTLAGLRKSMAQVVAGKLTTDRTTCTIYLSQSTCSKFLQYLKTNTIWALTWDFQQCGMCDRQRLWSDCAYMRSLIRAFTSRLNILSVLSYLEFQSSTGSSESTLVKIPHCWKSHVAAHMYLQIFSNEVSWFLDKRNRVGNIILTSARRRFMLDPPFPIIAPAFWKIT